MKRNSLSMPAPHDPSITVVGCGVIGLTTGIRLLESGYEVRIVARDLPPNTTSNIAAAVWFPYHVMPLDRVLGWSWTSLGIYYDLASDFTTGISLTTFIDLFEYPAPDPWWCKAVRQFRRPTPDELPGGYVDGHVAEVPLIETPVYMEWLVARFKKLGGRIEQRAVMDLYGIGDKNGVTVNCTGLGARELVGDKAMFPIRGQIARVTRPAGVDRVLFDEHGRHALAYVIPRRHEVIVGGTAQDGNWETKVDPVTATEILGKGAILAPALAGAEVLDHLVGLRPGRSAVRLEEENLTNGKRIIHNYGHGGAGFTLSWGCATEVVSLVEKITRER